GSRACSNASGLPLAVVRTTSRCRANRSSVTSRATAMSLPRPRRTKRPSASVVRGAGQGSRRAGGVGKLYHAGAGQSGAEPDDVPEVLPVPLDPADVPPPSPAAGATSATCSFAPLTG